MGIDTSGGNHNMDYPQHLSTYGSFVRLSIALIVFLVLLLAGMKYFLV
ncbi:MAG: aa3-type cytochrome c oxidase subunit IV [Hyphomicrobium sp.]